MNIVLNGASREVAPGLCVAALLASLQRPHKDVAVAVNLRVVPRREFDDLILEAGDRVDIVTAVGGG